MCAENTGGIFNASKALQEKINRLREREEVEAGGDETDEALLREYAEQKKRRVGTRAAGGSYDSLAQRDCTFDLFVHGLRLAKSIPGRVQVSRREPRYPLKSA